MQHVYCTTFRLNNWFEKNQGGSGGSIKVRFFEKLIAKLRFR